MRLGVSLEIFALKSTTFFIHFDTELHVQGHLLQELDDQTECDHFGGNIMKICLMVSKIFDVFYVFPGDVFPPGKWILTCATFSIHTAQFVISK